ncbi:MAG: outer membrane beta-barrel protein [Pseudomonadota bacterium]
MKKYLFGVAILSLALSSSVRAENGAKGDWELGPEVGVGFPDRYAPVNPDPGFLAGVRFSYAFCDTFSLEPSFHRVFSNATGALETVHFDSYRVNAVWGLNPGQTFRPFLTLGAGLERAHLPIGVHKDFAPNAGIGVKYYASRFGGFRLEGRYIPVKVGGVIDDWQHNFEGMLTFFVTLPARHEEEKVTPAPSATPVPAPQATPAVTPAPAPEPNAIGTPAATPTPNAP